MRSPHETPPAGPSFEHDTVRINARAPHYRAAGADAENVTNGCVYFTFRMKAITAKRARSGRGRARARPPPLRALAGGSCIAVLQRFGLGAVPVKTRENGGAGRELSFQTPFLPDPTRAQNLSKFGRGWADTLIRRA